jgi:hypothetical protein
MYRHLLRRRLPAGLLAAFLASAVAAAPAQAAAAQPAPAPAPAGPVGQLLDDVARQLATSFEQHPDLSGRVTEAPVDLLTVAPGSPLHRVAATANSRVLAAKGLPAGTGSVLRVRLADPAMAPALAAGEAPVVVPAASDESVSTVVGYRLDGEPVRLDATQMPERPVLLVDLDMAMVVPIGLAVLRERLAEQGVGTTAADQAVAAGYWATRINAVRLSDVKEPWFKGGAEIFSIVGGFDLQGEATVRVVEMPYLDDADRTYFPNQLLVHFNGYKYNLADVVMMEDDGDTNYQALAQALISVLLAITDLGIYQPLVDPILNAIPGSWWSDDPDYVESWYTLSTASAGRLHGAAGNGWMDVVPHFVEQL